MKKLYLDKMKSGGILKWQENQFIINQSFYFMFINSNYY